MLALMSSTKAVSSPEEIICLKLVLWWQSVFCKWLKTYVFLYSAHKMPWRWSWYWILYVVTVNKPSGEYYKNLWTALVFFHAVSCHTIFSSYAQALKAEEKPPELGKREGVGGTRGGVLLDPKPLEQQVITDTRQKVLQLQLEQD